MEQVIMESSEAHEEAIGNNMNDYGYIVKGKRTKRQRLVLPTSATTMTSSSSGGSGGGGGGDDRSLPSPTTSTGFSGSTQEEEDMANCLILLARGGLQPRLEESGAERFSSRRFAEAAAATTTTAGKPGFDVYECKTCNRCFPSFQALGGHRASHKKPKAAVEEKKPLEEENETAGSPQKSTIPYNKSRVHECSICGSEFSSGQALGGHMRRHRTAAIVEAQENRRKERNILPLDLDLNLPAPEEDRDFMTGKPPLLFPASALVDCHY